MPLIIAEMQSSVGFLAILSLLEESFRWAFSLVCIRFGTT